MPHAWKLGLLAVVVSPMLMGNMSMATAGRDGHADPRLRSNDVQLAALFGESDEEKAARQQHEDNQDLTIQALGQRVHDLEETLRQATGQNETLAHRVQELSDKLDRQQKDFEYRLCAMQAQQLGATPGQPGTAPGDNTLPCNPTGPMASNRPPGPAQASIASSPQLGRPPGTLGTLSEHDAMPPAPSGPDPQAQYNAALNLLAKGQNDEARADFRSFADANPKDPQAPQAIYWIGRISYVQKDYPGAARAFVEEIKKYPTSGNAPESMIKLGESLIAMGQKKEGCTALAALKSKYPSASKSLLAKAAESRKAFCR